MSYTVTELRRDRESTESTERISYKVEGTDDPSIAVLQGHVKGILYTINGRLFKVEKKRARMLIPEQSCILTIDFVIPELTGEDPDDEDFLEISVDLGNTTTRMMAARSQTAIGSSPDHHGLIGIQTGDTSKVNGVEVDEATFAFTVTLDVADDDFDTAYLAGVVQLRNKINSGSFAVQELVFLAGEVKFDGASFNKVWDRDEEAYIWKCGFKFQARPNETIDWIEDFGSFEKGAWQYMEVYGAEYITEEGGSGSASAGDFAIRAKAVYLNDVYETGDFSVLGFGTHGGGS